VIDELNNCVDTQDIQIEQLANMVNNLIRKMEKQQKEIKDLKSDQEMHCKVINTLMAKVIALEECVEGVQKKAFPQVGGMLPNYQLLIDMSSSYRLLWCSLVNKLLCRRVTRWLVLLFVVNTPIEGLV
jgi:hypothetical protein